MYKEINIFNSTTFQNVIKAIKPWNAPEGIIDYPREIKDEDLKFNGDHQAWFRNIIDNILEKNIEKCKVEDNIAAFISYKWTNYNILDHANIQILALEENETLENFYEEKLKRKSICSYFRLDLDYNKRGLIFKEALPHIHCNKNKEPRFYATFEDKSNNIIIDFFDFIFRNYKYKKWEQWVSHIINQQKFDIPKNYYKHIKEIYEDNTKVALLTKPQKDFIKEIQKLISDNKSEFFEIKL